MTTRAPSATKRRAVAAPIPDAAPVITATFPVNLPTVSPRPTWSLPIPSLMTSPFHQMHDTHGADTDHVGHAVTGVGLLAVPCLAPQLADHLGDLAGAGRSQRVAHGQQPTAGRHRAAAADVPLPRLQPTGRFARAAEPHRFEVEQLLDRERVVDLQHVDVVGADAGLVEQRDGRCPR